MASIVRMPELVTGSTEAAIAGWLVAEGEEISAGQAIVEIETEKATVEYAAEEAGVLAGLLLAAGDAAQVGSPIAVLATGGQSIAEAIAEAGIGAAAGASDGPGGAATSPPGPEQNDAEPAATPAAAAPSARVASGADLPAQSDGLSDTHLGDRLFASPLVRKLARERGLDLAGVQGTGPGGRIVRRDIESSARATAEGASVQQAPLPSAAPPPAAAAAPAAPLSTGPFTDVPHTGMRRAIARRLTESKSTVPHFYLRADCHVDALLALRAQINELAGTRVSVNDFVVKAVAAAMQDVPAANAIWTEAATRRFDGVDIAVAVSVPDGLLTPVVRGVERLSIGSLSREIRDYAERARSGRLRQHELEGGTFSVSNLGMYGTREFSAILNPPQAGILAVGVAERRPVVTDDGELGIATLMTVTLSADHRVLDGALAAEWLSAFTRRIEQPMSLVV